MVSVDQIIEEAQSLDLSGDRVQRGEYISLFLEVSKQTAMQTHLWQGRYTATPNPSSAPSTTPVYEVVIPYADPTDPSSIYSPYRILRVVRSLNGVISETQEFSPGAINSTISTNKSFPTNDVIINRRGFSIDFQNANGLVDDSRRLTFAAEFQLQEEVVVDYIMDNPYGTLTTWEKSRTVPMVVPDFLFKTLKYGLIAAVYERLGLQGDEGALQKSQLFEQKYKEALKEAMVHSRMFKNNPDEPYIQPYKPLTDPGD